MSQIVTSVVVPKFAPLSPADTAWDDGRSVTDERRGIEPDGDGSGQVWLDAVELRNQDT